MKKIKVGNIDIEITDARKKRFENEIAITSGKLEKELGFSEDLQDTEQIAFYRSHLERLDGYLQEVNHHEEMVERARKVALWAVNKSKWTLTIGLEFIERAKSDTLEEWILESFEDGMEALS